MPETDPPRARAARKAAEEALVRVIHHYGETPEFVLLGGLVPELFCDKSAVRHAGTTDVDVQVDLEIATGATNAEFESTDGQVWRWQTEADGVKAIVKFELLADLDNAPADSTVIFAECQSLGAVNLRGTGFASRDFAPHPLRSKVGGVFYDVTVNVTGLSEFLLAKAAAVYSRRKDKDRYDIAFVLFHNNEGGPGQAAALTRKLFGTVLTGSIRSALDDVTHNFTVETNQGPVAYASQFAIDHPDSDEAQSRADAVLAVRRFHSELY